MQAYTEPKNCKNKQSILLDGVFITFIYFLRGISKKSPSLYILKLCSEIGQSFEESLQGGKLVKNLGLF